MKKKRIKNKTKTKNKNKINNIIKRFLKKILESENSMSASENTDFLENWVIIFYYIIKNNVDENLINNIDNEEILKEIFENKDNIKKYLNYYKEINDKNKKILNSEFDKFVSSEIINQSSYKKTTLIYLLNTAMYIYNKYGKNFHCIRGSYLNNWKHNGSLLVKHLSGKQLFNDVWCPGDILLVNNIEKFIDFLDNYNNVLNNIKSNENKLYIFDLLISYIKNIKVRLNNDDKNNINDELIIIPISLKKSVNSKVKQVASFVSQKIENYDSVDDNFLEEICELEEIEKNIDNISTKGEQIKKYLNYISELEFEKYMLYYIQNIFEIKKDTSNEIEKNTYSDKEKINKFKREINMLKKSNDNNINYKFKINSSELYRDININNTKITKKNFINKCNILIKKLEKIKSSDKIIEEYKKNMYIIDENKNKIEENELKKFIINIINKTNILIDNIIKKFNIENNNNLKKFYYNIYEYNENENDDKNNNYSLGFLCSKFVSLIALYNILKYLKNKSNEEKYNFFNELLLYGLGFGFLLSKNFFNESDLSKSEIMEKVEKFSILNPPYIKITGALNLSNIKEEIFDSENLNYFVLYCKRDEENDNNIVSWEQMPIICGEKNIIENSSSNKIKSKYIYFYIFVEDTSKKNEENSIYKLPIAIKSPFNSVGKMHRTMIEIVRIEKVKNMDVFLKTSFF